MSDHSFTKTTGKIAIIAGFIESIFYSLNYFVDHYTGVGSKDWGSSLAFALLLIVSGILLCSERNTGKSFLKGYFGGTLIDRIIVFLLYGEYLHSYSLLIPVILALPFGTVLFYPKFAPYFGYKLSLKNKVLLSILVLFIILFPKLISSY